MHYGYKNNFVFFGTVTVFVISYIPKKQFYTLKISCYFSNLRFAIIGSQNISRHKFIDQEFHYSFLSLM